MATELTVTVNFDDGTTFILRKTLDHDLTTPRARTHLQNALRHRMEGLDKLRQ